MTAFADPIDAPTRTPTLSRDKASLTPSSSAVGKAAALIREQSDIGTLSGTAGQSRGIASISFDLKRRLAQTALHLESDWLAGVFEQLDFALDEESWDVEDLAPSVEAWRTAIRLLVYCPLNQMPGIGFTHGHPLLMWFHNSVRITVECSVGDKVHWVASNIMGGDEDVSAGDTTVKRLAAHLAVYNHDNWLFDAGQ